MPGSPGTPISPLPVLHLPDAPGSIGRLLVVLALGRCCLSVSAGNPSAALNSMRTGMADFYPAIINGRSEWVRKQCNNLRIPL